LPSEDTEGQRSEGLSLIWTCRTGAPQSKFSKDIAGYKPNSFYLTDRGEVERFQGMRVTANFFRY